MSSPEDNILAKEIESWKGFEYALRQQNAKPFNQMLKEYWRADPPFPRDIAIL
jgi:hypothetical protein